MCVSFRLFADFPEPDFIFFLGHTVSVSWVGIQQYWGDTFCKKWRKKTKFVQFPIFHICTIVRAKGFFYIRESILKTTFTSWPSWVPTQSVRLGTNPESRVFHMTLTLTLTLMISWSLVSGQWSDQNGTGLIGKRCFCFMMWWLWWLWRCYCFYSKHLDVVLGVDCDGGHHWLNWWQIIVAAAASITLLIISLPRAILHKSQCICIWSERS